MSLTVQEEALREWLYTLSDMVNGDIGEDCTLEEALAWFGEIPDDTLANLQAFGGSIREFVELGPELMKAAR